MYSTKPLNGSRDVSGSWDYWEFARQLCRQLNSLKHEQPAFLNEHDGVWLEEMDRAFSRKVQHV